MQITWGDKERNGHSPGHTGHRALREFHGKSPAHAPGTQVCQEHTVCAGLKVLLGSVACGKSCGPLSGREGFCFPEQVRRDPVKLLLPLKVVM